MKKNDGTMFRSILTLALTAVMLLSGMLGISAQAAKNKPALEIPTDIFGETWIVEHYEDINTSIVLFGPASEETIEAYVNDLAEALKLDVKTERDEDTMLYTLCKQDVAYVMVLDDGETGLMCVAFMLDNVDLISDEDARKDGR